MNGSPTSPRAEPEPSLAEMLRDPIVKALMSGDGVTEAEILRLVDEVKSSAASPKSSRTVEA